MVLTATIAGLLAGMVMSVEKMLEAALKGDGFWRPPNLISSMVLGQRVETGRFLLDGFLVGMALHVLASAFMGWLYAVVVAEHVQHWPALLEVVVILGYALVHWATWQYVLMPWLAPRDEPQQHPGVTGGRPSGLGCGLRRVVPALLRAVTTPGTCRSARRRAGTARHGSGSGPITSRRASGSSTTVRPYPLEITPCRRSSESARVTDCRRAPSR